jgi:hypothetical protein
MLRNSLNWVLHSSKPSYAATGLFAYSHLDFEADRDIGPNGDPSLADMTRVALSILAKNPRGFLLFVEGKYPESVTSLLSLVRTLLTALPASQMVPFLTLLCIFTE